MRREREIGRENSIEKSVYTRSVACFDDVLSDDRVTKLSAYLDIITFIIQHTSI